MKQIILPETSCLLFIYIQFGITNALLMRMTIMVKMSLIPLLK